MHPHGRIRNGATQRCTIALAPRHRDILEKTVAEREWYAGQAIKHGCPGTSWRVPDGRPGVPAPWTGSDHFPSNAAATDSGPGCPVPRTRTCSDFLGTDAPRREAELQREASWSTCRNSCWSSGKALPSSGNIRPNLELGNQDFTDPLSTHTLSWQLLVWRSS